MTRGPGGAAQVDCKGGGEPCNEPGHGLYTCRETWQFDGTTGDFRCGGNAGLGDDGFNCDRNTIVFSCAEGADHDDFRCCGDGHTNDDCFTCHIGSHFAGCKTPNDFLCTPGFVDEDPIWPQGLGGSACEPSSGFSEQL